MKFKINDQVTTYDGYEGRIDEIVKQLDQYKVVTKLNGIRWYVEDHLFAAELKHGTKVRVSYRATVNSQGKIMGVHYEAKWPDAKVEVLEYPDETLHDLEGTIRQNEPRHGVEQPIWIKHHDGQWHTMSDWEPTVLKRFGHTPPPITGYVQGSSAAKVQKAVEAFPTVDALLESHEWEYYTNGATLRRFRKDCLDIGDYWANNSDKWVKAYGFHVSELNTWGYGLIDPKTITDKQRNS